MNDPKTMTVTVTVTVTKTITVTKTKEIATDKVLQEWWLTQGVMQTLAGEGQLWLTPSLQSSRILENQAWKVERKASKVEKLRIRILVVSCLFRLSLLLMFGFLCWSQPRLQSNMAQQCATILGNLAWKVDKQWKTKFFFFFLSVKFPNCVPNMQ